MIPLFKTFAFIHRIAKILFRYEVLYLLLMTGLSFLVCSGKDGARCKAGQLKITLAQAALRSPAFLFVFLHTETRALLLRGAELWHGATLGYESWFFQPQILPVNSIWYCLTRTQNVSHMHLFIEHRAQRVTPLWQSCPCCSDKRPHTEKSQELGIDSKLLTYF